MALSRITANSIEDGTVVASDIADGSITTAKIADGNVTAAKVSTIANTQLTGTITTAQLGTGAVSNTKIASGAVEQYFADTGYEAQFRNRIINGCNRIWQRSTSNTLVSAGTYITNDRWKYWASGATLSSARTAFTPGQTDVPGFEYYNRIVVGANSGSGDYATFNQSIEDVIQFDAQTVTLSFYAKASQAWTISIEPIQNFGSGGSARVLVAPQTVNISTSWARHTVTIALPSISGKTLGSGHNLEVAFWLSGGSDFNSRTGSIGNRSGTFDVTGVQLEVGSVATPFERRPHGMELSLCQRYFERFTGANSHAGLYSGTTYIGHLFYKVTKRTRPTLSSPSGAYSELYVSSSGDEGGLDNMYFLGSAGSYLIKISIDAEL